MVHGEPLWGIGPVTRATMASAPCLPGEPARTRAAEGAGRWHRADPERPATSEAVATDDTGMMAAAGYTLFTSVPHRMRAQTRSCRT